MPVTASAWSASIFEAEMVGADGALSWDETTTLLVAGDNADFCRVAESNECNMKL